jgi:methylmalonyl-CoA/ethylmalonyl-CoA epimerase
MIYSNTLKYHHVGLLVESIEESIEHYSALFGKFNVSDIFVIQSQKVKVCFVKNAHDSYIELVQPLGEDSVVAKLLKKRMSYYHLGYKVANIENAVTELEQLNYKPMEYFNSEAFNGKRCIFLFTPETHLIELIEQ